MIAQISAELLKLRTTRTTLACAVICFRSLQRFC